MQLVNWNTNSHLPATLGVDIISYRPEGSPSQNWAQSDLVIKTYRDSASYNAQLRSLEASAPFTVETLNGINVSYNPSSPDHVVIFFKNRPQVVAIHYPNIQSISRLIRDAQSLEPIR
jgi:hypothetical protein